MSFVVALLSSSITYSTDNLAEGSFHTLKTKPTNLFPVIFNSDCEFPLETYYSFVLSLLRAHWGS